MIGADLSFVASANIARRLFVVVHPDGVDAKLPRVVVNSISGGPVSGVSKGQDVLTGEDCSVTILGYAKVIAAEAIPIGSPVASDASGKAIVGNPTLMACPAFSITQATAADDIIDIILVHKGKEGA